LIHPDQYPLQVIRLAVLVLAEDQDAVAVAHHPRRVPKDPDATARLGIERSRIVTEDMAAGGAAEHRR